MVVNFTEAVTMTKTTAKLADQLLSLPCEDRIFLVDTLLRSLNAPSREDIDRAWAEEAERRLDDLESGKAHLLPGNQVITDIRKRLGK